MMRMLCITLLLALAGCASVDTQPTRTPVALAAATTSARALASQHASLNGQARRDNTAAIERLLAQLDNATLAHDAAQLPTGDPLYNFAGRALINRGLPLPRDFDRVASSFGAATRPPAANDGYRPPLKVALLLPQTGSQAAVAAAVRDGYLTGYYGEQRRRPELHVYDTSSGVAAAYTQAVAAGNDLVVGPLIRDDVDALFARNELPVPVLALNRGSRVPTEGSADFSLSPEDEGISIAHYLIDQHKQHVVIIAGASETQRRTANSVRDQLTRRGVQVVADLRFGAAMQDVLMKAAQAQSAPDAVILTLKADQARALAPQLAAAGLQNTLRVASSQITLGSGKAEIDAALDGMIFPTERWDVHRVEGLPSQASAALQLHTAKGPAARLFAFGFDAWRLTGYLEHLAQSANTEIAGATGYLSLDGFGNVLRRPSWSQFRAGVPVPLADGAR